MIVDPEASEEDVIQVMDGTCSGLFSQRINSNTLLVCCYTSGECSILEVSLFHEKQLSPVLRER